MTEQWWETFQFKEDPYQGDIDPYAKPEWSLKWNRNDLTEGEGAFNGFIEDIERRRKVTAYVWGPWRSGKTWISRLIEKELRKKMPEILVIRVQVRRSLLGLIHFYRRIIEDTITSEKRGKKIMDRFKEYISEKRGNTQAEWRNFFGDRDLGTALFEIAHDGDSAYICKNWIQARSVSANYLKEPGILAPLKEEDVIEDVLEKLIEKFIEIFSGILIIIDQMEEAKPSLARDISSTMRRISDKFKENFALCLLLQGEEQDQWVDRGYDEALFARIRHRIRLDPISSEYAPEFLRRHNEVYREKGFEGDQIYPFTEDGAKRLIQLLGPENSYPGSKFFQSCEELARISESEGGKEITKEFVDKNKKTLDIVVQTGISEF